jgi:ATP-dependent protease ClpP protease subunit
MSNESLKVSQGFLPFLEVAGRLDPKTLGHVFEYYISGEIKEPELYIDWFDEIRHAGENDVVKIRINSTGGDLFTGIQFMRVLSETDATVRVSVEGACMSAATLIFLCADQFEISEHSSFMFHNYSGGTYGKGGEQFDQLVHERRWSEKLLKEVYEGFLTPQEIRSLLDNKDLWMDIDEVILRMEERNKVLAASEAADLPE